MAVKSLFLTHFNVHSGYETVWYKFAGEEVNLQNIEYKTMPSGSHSIKKDIVCFVHEGYQGVSIFKQNMAAGSDRSTVKMYSLGVLSDEPMEVAYSLKDQLDLTLNKLMILDNLTDEVLDAELGLLLWGKLAAASKVACKDLADELPAIFENLGPLIYTLCKLIMVGKRIIIYSSEDGNHDLLNKYIYCLNLISRNCNTPIYNICIIDIDYLSQLDSYLGYTNDMIILEKPQLYDYKLEIGEGLPKLEGSDGQIVHCSNIDLNHFVSAYTQLKGFEPSIEYFKLAKYKSLAEMFFFVMNWWATSGDSYRRQIEISLQDNNIQVYFEKLIKLLDKNLKELSIEEEALDPNEIVSVGLDPSNQIDLQFLNHYFKVNYNRDVVIGKYINCFC